MSESWVLAPKANDNLWLDWLRFYRRYKCLHYMASIFIVLLFGALSIFIAVLSEKKDEAERLRAKAETASRQYLQERDATQKLVDQLSSDMLKHTCFLGPKSMGKEKSMERSCLPFSTTWPEMQPNIPRTLRAMHGYKRHGTLLSSRTSIP
ncbi:MAG: hypothetical protein HQL32_12020 [Planctomycetes bacterium]|nr:hypothetical protein [Planctomycetota bacterium]